MKSTLKYGIGAGIALSILVFAGYSMEWYKVSFKFGWTLLEIAIISFAIYYGVKEIRAIKYNGEVKYRHALAEGMKILFILTFIHSLSIFLYFQLNEKGFTEYKNYTYNSAVTAMKKAGYPQTDINKFAEIVKTGFTPINLGKDNILYDFLLGLIVSLIIASILRKKDNPNPPEIKLS